MPDDQLWKISLQYNVSEELLLETNNIRDLTCVKELLIPFTMESINVSESTAQ